MLSQRCTCIAGITDPGRDQPPAHHEARQIVGWQVHCILDHEKISDCGADSDRIILQIDAVILKIRCCHLKDKLICAIFNAGFGDKQIHEKI